MELIKCAKSDCLSTFEYAKFRYEKKYCSRRCKSTDKSRRYRGTWTKEKKDRYNISVRKRWQTNHARYLKLVNSSKGRGIEVFITEEQYSEIVKEGVCFYCGLGLFDGSTFRTCVDRYDGKIGYTFDNCRACCWRCNEVKGSLERWFSPEKSVVLLREYIEEST